MTEPLHFDLTDEAATEAMGVRFAAALDGGLVIWLHGELGAGKTSFARALLRARGAGERIKSPTYSLVESYDLADGSRAWHLDLYRIAAAGELEWLGLDALGEPQALVLVEWPEHGLGALPAADLLLRLTHADPGRQAEWTALSPRGQAVLTRLSH